jgi:hypothetical protein
MCACAYLPAAIEWVGKGKDTADAGNGIEVV